MTVIDSSVSVSGHISDLKNRGVTAIGRYYSSSAKKRLTTHEAKEIANAGLDIFVIFENDGDPILTHAQGVYHAQIALDQAKAVQQPDGSAIYFALEHLPSGYKRQHIKSIKDYVSGIKEVISEKYKIGIYSDGVVLISLINAGLCDYAWLSASTSFDGSKEFYASGKWSLAQKTPVDMDWNGVSVDINEAKENFGSFKLPSRGHDNVLMEAVDVIPEGVDEVEPNFAARLRKIGLAEWEFFGEQQYNLDGNTVKRGHSEGEGKWADRIGVYWLEGTKTHGIDGRNHSWFWSAAFISWCEKKAGAGDRFRYSTQHSVYISQGIRDFLRKRKDAGYWTYRLNDAKPEIGDIICWSREAGVDYDHQKNGNYSGHCDIVVDVDAAQIVVIGGNVGNSVTRRPVRLDTNGHVVPALEHGEKLFALMKSRIA